ncbi:MAG: cyclase family protein [Chloroflexi bacterium]|nr:cyclase family protein [Chloroflexota bacterium]
MPRILDLTLALGDPRLEPPAVIKVPLVSLEPIHVHARDGRSNSKVSFWTHIGTHIDPPYHFVDGGQTIDDVPLERLIGAALRIDLRPVMREKTALTAADVERQGYRQAEVAGKIAVLHSGWMERKFGTPEFTTHYPWYDVSVAQWLVAGGAKAVVVDTYIDHVEVPRPGDCPCHRTLLGNGVPIIENVVNLEQIAAREFTMYALPIKLYRGDGGQARVIALLDE